MGKKYIFITAVFMFFVFSHFTFDQKANAFFFGLSFGGRVTLTYYCLNGVIFWSHLPVTQSLIPYFAPYIQLKPIHPFIPPIISNNIKGKAAPIPLPLCAVPYPPFLLPLPVFPVLFFSQSK